MGHNTPHKDEKSNQIKQSRVETTKSHKES